uniref:FBA_2 domain-containing protein n=1 Tax=Steinernema glaseri TaxID=37863 RepID=A0A1I7Y241_9BILA
MDSVPILFVRDVVSLALGSSGISYRELRKLASPAWANVGADYVKNKLYYYIYMTLSFPPYRPYEIVVVRSDSSGRRFIMIDDFDAFDVERDAIWGKVSLGFLSAWDLPFGHEDYISRTWNSESVANCLRRILHGRDCRKFESQEDFLGPEHFMLLASLPRTFQVIRFVLMCKEAEEFIMETAKLQKLSVLEVRDEPMSKEFESFFHKMVLSGELLRIVIVSNSIEGYDFGVFETLLQRWIEDPVGFNSHGELSHLKELKQDAGCMYYRRHLLANSVASVWFESNRLCHFSIEKRRRLPKEHPVDYPEYTF